MVWTHTRAWPTNTAGTAGTTSSSNTAAPAAEGSSLVAYAFVRPVTTPSATPPITVTDNLGGSWEGSTLAGTEASSTRLMVFVRNAQAGGVSSVTVTSPGTQQIHFHVHEFSGGPEYLTLQRPTSADVRPDGDAWAPLTVDAPANSLVLGAASLGVTNRAIVPEPPFTLASEQKMTGVHSLSAYLIVGESGQAVGPTWTKTSGSGSSLVTATAAVIAGSGPEPLTVSVGTDRETLVGEPVNLAATASGGAGTRQYQWTASGSGTFTEPTNSSTQFTPNADGTVTVTCQVTDGTGTASDSLVLTVAPRPRVAPVAATGWSTVSGQVSALVALTDEDPATYVGTGPNPDAEVLTITFPGIETPEGEFVVPLELSVEGPSGWIVPQIENGAGWTDAAPIYVTGARDTYEARWSVSSLAGVPWATGFDVRLLASADDVL